MRAPKLGRGATALKGIDYQNLRADGRLDVNFHAEITTDDHKKVALYANGVVYVKPGESVAQVRLSVTLTTADPEYSRVNRIQIWGREPPISRRAMSGTTAMPPVTTALVPLKGGTNVSPLRRWRFPTSDASASRSGEGSQAPEATTVIQLLTYGQDELHRLLDNQAVKRQSPEGLATGWRDA